MIGPETFSKKMPVVGAISLGCEKNRIDTEEILGILNHGGYPVTEDLQEAEIIIVNTCAFISGARSESTETLNEASSYKKNGRCRLLVAAGCLPQRYHSDLLKEVPGVDLVVGVHSYKRIDQLLQRAFNKKIRMTAISSPPVKYPREQLRFLTRPGHSVFLKIAEGCNNRCHYCTIPEIRGPYRSRPAVSIINEAEMLARGGTREINLVAQDTTYYGMEKGGKTLLPQLLKRLARVDGIEWIRLLYAHPGHLDDETIEVMSSESKICPYIDIPLQHVNDRVLKNMGRPYTRERIIYILRKLRQNNMTIRSTFLLGYPGETEDDFSELLEFIKKYPIDRAGAFVYSPEKNTTSYSQKNHVPVNIRQKRYDRFMSVQKKISYFLNRSTVGSCYPVLVEGETPENNKGVYYTGRTIEQAPEVDGRVIFYSDTPLRQGQMVNVKIYGCGSYDLLGRYNK